MSRFVRGQKVEAIWWEEGVAIEVGQCGCESITVVMENGQMAEVPWFEVIYAADSVYDSAKHNGALISGVRV